jgi:hypothetical protein
MPRILVLLILSCQPALARGIGMIPAVAVGTGTEYLDVSVEAFGLQTAKSDSHGAGPFVGRLGYGARQGFYQGIGIGDIGLFMISVSYDAVLYFRNARPSAFVVDAGVGVGMGLIRLQVGRDWQKDELMLGVGILLAHGIWP